MLLPLFVPFLGTLLLLGGAEERLGILIIRLSKFVGTFCKYRLVTTPISEFASICISVVCEESLRIVSNIRHKQVFLLM